MYLKENAQHLHYKDKLDNGVYEKCKAFFNIKIGGTYSNNCTLES